MKRIFFFIISILISLVTYSQINSTFKNQRTKPFFPDTVQVNKSLYIGENIYQWNGASFVELEGSKWDNTTGGINYTVGNVGINTASPTKALDVNGESRFRSIINWDDGSGNSSVPAILMYVRGREFIRSYGAYNTINAPSLITGYYSLHNFTGDKTNANILAHAISYGFRNMYYGDSILSSHAFGALNFVTTALRKYRLEDCGAFGSSNFNTPYNNNVNQTVFLSNCYAFGKQNGDALMRGSSNVYMLGSYLFDLYDQPYLTTPIKDVYAIGQRPEANAEPTIEMTGSIIIYNGADSSSWMRFNADDFYDKDGLPLSLGGGGDFYSTDTTLYHPTKALIIGASEPDSTEMLRVNGDIYVEGSIYGTYVNNPGTDNIFFGESIQVTDSTVMLVELVAGESVTIGKPVYTYYDHVDDTWELYLSDAAVDSAARVQYIVFQEAGDGDEVLVVKPASFIINDSWIWGNGVIYLNRNGGLTQTAVNGSGEWITEVGWAVAPNKMFFFPQKSVEIP